MHVGRAGEYVMEETTEVLHIVSSDQFPERLHFVQRGDRYAVIDVKSQGRTEWMSAHHAIKWAFIPSALDACHKMDRFIKGYFPESLVTLVALENL